MKTNYKRRLRNGLGCIAFLFAASAGIAQQSYTFTNASATGKFGPTSTQVSTAYSSSSLAGSVTVSAGIQSFTIPVTGQYKITAYGAKGGGNPHITTYSGGNGAMSRGVFTLTAGTVIQVLVGQMGSNGQGTGYYTAGGGGGGSFVRASNTLIIAAAGGGGAGIYHLCCAGANGVAGATTTAGTAANGSGFSFSNGSPGSSGNGGTGGNWYAGSGGGGYLSSGGNSTGGSTSTGGFSYLSGGVGGNGGNYSGYVGGDGGFGGGAGGMFGGGGAGGYSGGAGGVHDGNSSATGGGGGGSYNASSSPTMAAGVNSGHGYVVLERFSMVQIMQASPISCYGQSTGALSASVTGGTPPYTYSWSPIGLTTQSISGLNAGVYTVTVTDSNSLTFVNTYTLTEPPLLQNVVISQNSVTCNGGNNGAVALNVFGGTAPYSYTWSPSGGNTNTGTNLTAGNYTVLIRDVNNCASTRTVAVAQPGPVSVAGFATSPVVCFGGQTTLIAAGALTYTWSHGVTNGVAFTPTVTRTYTVTGTDSNGCNGTGVVTVTVNASPNVSVTASSSVICSGQSSNLLATGAVSYTWNTSAISNAITVAPNVTTTYTVTGTNSQGCTKSAVKTVTVINSTPNVTANSPKPQVCIGGTTSVSGGGAVSYTWTGGVTNNVAFTPGATQSYTVTGSNSCGTGTAAITITVQPLPVITGSASTSAICLGNPVTLTGMGGVTYTWSNGVVNNAPFTPAISRNYTVTGASSFGCRSTGMVSVTVLPLPVINITASSTLVCSGNPVTLTASGALSYTWNNGVLNGVPFNPTITLTYNASGTNSNGCVGSAARTISVTTPPALTITSSTTQVCQGGAVTLSGAGSNTLLWTPSITNGVPFVPTTSGQYVLQGVNGCGTSTLGIGISVLSLPPVTANASSSAVCIGGTLVLSGGGANVYSWSHSVTDNASFVPTVTRTYSVTGTDANGCQSTATTAVIVNPLPAVTVSSTANAVCPGFSVALSGQGAVSYNWSHNVTDNVPFSPMSTAVYTVTGTDANGCSSFAVKTITVNTPPSVFGNVSSNAVCFGQPVTFFASGAHTYTWTGGVINGQAYLPTVTGSYSVVGTNTVTGCTSTNNAIVNVTVNAIPSVTATPSASTICQGQSINLQGSGANFYTWSGGIQNGQNFVPGNAGTFNYTVTGSTSAGCSNTAVATFTVYARPFVSGFASPPQVCAGGTVTLNGSGANTYTWSQSVQNGVPFAVFTSGLYSLAGTNTLTGCTSTNQALVNVTANQPPTVFVSQSASVVCAGSSVIFNGIGAHTYSWSGGIQNNVAFFPTTSGVYTVLGTHTVTGCTNTAVAGVTVNPLPSLTVQATDQAICIGDSVTITISGATNYTLSPGWAPGVSFKPVNTATYSANGTNSVTGCKTSSATSIVISVSPLPTVTTKATPSVVCAGDPVVLTGQGAHLYYWSGGVLNGVSFSAQNTGSFTLSGTDTLTGCTSTNLAVQWIQVNSRPNMTISQSHSVICVGESVMLVGYGAVSYTWSTAETTRSIVVMPVVSTSYTLMGTAVNGCTAEVSFMQDVSDCVGIGEAGGVGPWLSVYPNPTDGPLFISTSQDRSVDLYSASGQLLMRVELKGGTSSALDLRHLAKGIYLLRSAENPELTYKVVLGN